MKRYDLLKKAAAFATAVFVSLSSIGSAVSADSEDGYSVYAGKGFKKVEISSKEDFLKFAEECVLDSNSEKKYYVLTCDISLGSFTPVPSFSGIFDGCGHTLNGMTISGSGSEQGLFRYIEKDGLVKNLNVTGSVIPSGSASECGGIAGVNRGRIIGCSFNGAVKGKNLCGGIAGRNDESGLIANCTSNGAVQSVQYTGGIAGENNGTVLYCTNNSSVNTNAYDKTIDLEALDVDEIYSMDKSSDISDAGGIVGFSDGSLQNCVNNGNVGYPHVGYNIGGIAGRQNGYVSGCVNYGVINGRKDTAGIVGQAEPHISLLFSERTLSKLRTQLEELNAIIDRTINDADSRTGVMSESTDDILDELNEIRSGTDSFLDETDRIVNADIDSINELSSRISDLIDMAAPAADSFTEASDLVSGAMENLEEASRLLQSAGDTAGDGMEVLFPALSRLSDAVDCLSNASGSLDESLEALSQAMGDEEIMKIALEALSEDYKALSSAMSKVSEAASEALKALNEFADSPEYEMEMDNIREQLKRLAEIAKNMSYDMSQSESSVNSVYTLLEGGHYDEEMYDPYVRDILDVWNGGEMEDFFDCLGEIASSMSNLMSSQAAEALREALRSSSEDMAEGLDELSGAGENVSSDLGTILFDNPDVGSLYDFIDYIRETNSNLSETADPIQSMIDCIQDSYDYFDEAGASAVAAVACAADASEDAAKAADKIKDGFGNIADILDYFTGKDKISFTGADEDFISAREQVSELLNNLIGLCGDFNENAETTVSVLSEDMHLINSKAEEVSTTLLDLADEMSSKSSDISDYTEDISSEDTIGRSDGKIADCKNFGQVNGDVSVGGIAGAMAVEYDFDPEGDIETIGDRSANFMYQSKTVVRSCVNYGEVISKKNKAGGIAGEMETGCLINCCGFGSVTSTDGSYAGGIVGKSSAAVFGCSAKCRIGGTDYVGGIAGEGKDIKNCKSFVVITDGDERVGAVAGQADGELSGNIFIDGGIGGIDGISYKGKAYPVPYEYMLAAEDVPEEFGVITLTFISDGEVTKEVECGYGEALAEKNIPEIPQKDGCFAKWENFDFSEVLFDSEINAVYTSYVTAIASIELRENKLPIIIVQGSFTDEDKVTAHSGENINYAASDKWTVTLPEDGNTVHTVRYLSCIKPQNAEVILTENGVERIAEAEVDGQYLVFEVNGSSFDIYVKRKASLWPVYAAAAVLAAAAVVIIIIMIKRKKKS